MRSLRAPHFFPFLYRNGNTFHSILSTDTYYREDDRDMKFGLAKLAFDAPELPNAPTIENPLKVPEIKPNDVPTIGTTSGVINGATMKAVKPPALPKVAAEQEVTEEQEERKKPLLTVPGVLAGVGASEIGKRLGSVAGDTLGYELGYDAGKRKLERYIAEHPELSPDDKESIRYGYGSYESSVKPAALKGQRIGRRAGKIIGGTGLGAVGITLGNMYSNRNKEATTMNYELAKIARDYSRDPIWKLLNEDRDASEAAYEEALAARNPEILDKQHEAYATGTAIGAGVGGTAGAIGGTAAGLSQPGRPIPRLVAGGVGGLTGAVAGGLGGALAGLVAASPVAWMHGLKEDPEVRRRVNETSSHHLEALARKQQYELNDPIFGARQPIQERQAAEQDFGFSKLASQYEELMNVANQADQPTVSQDQIDTIEKGIKIGGGIGATTAGLSGLLSGAVMTQGMHPVARVGLTGATGLLGAASGGIGGAVMGGAAALPIAYFQGKNQAPELAQNEDYYGPEKEASEVRQHLEKVANDFANMSAVDAYQNDPQYRVFRDDLKETKGDLEASENWIANGKSKDKFTQVATGVGAVGGAVGGALLGKHVPLPRANLATGLMGLGLGAAAGEGFGNATFKRRYPEVHQVRDQYQKEHDEAKTNYSNYMNEKGYQFN